MKLRIKFYTFMNTLEVTMSEHFITALAITIVLGMVFVAVLVDWVVKIDDRESALDNRSHIKRTPLFKIRGRK